MDSIIFVNPCWDYMSEKGKRHNRKWPPLSLLYCASLFDHAVILDANALELDEKQIIEKIKKFDKIFITTSTLDRWQCPNLDITPVEKILRLLSNKSVYLIGFHGSVMPDYFFDNFNIKAIIVGEPEITVKEICEKKSLRDIKGIIYKKNSKLIKNEERKLLDLKDLPVPEFSRLPLENYSYEIMGDRFMLFEFSRGCPFNCTYCNQLMYGQKYRTKPIEKMIKEIEIAVNKFGVKNAYFIDLEMTINKKSVEQLCNLIISKDLNFSWTCQTRADSIDESLLKKMKQAGCSLIHFGVETGSPKIMKSINKKITLEKIEEGVNLAKKLDIETACFFMFGFPSETKEDMRMTIDFAKKLNPDYASFHTASIYPETEMFKNIKENKKLPFDEAYTKEHSLKDLKKVSRRAFLEFYLRPRYVVSRISKPKNIFKQISLFLKHTK